MAAAPKSKQIPTMGYERIAKGNKSPSVPCRHVLYFFRRQAGESLFTQHDSAISERYLDLWLDQNLVNNRTPRPLIVNSQVRPACNMGNDAIEPALCSQTPLNVDSGKRCQQRVSTNNHQLLPY